MSLMLAFVAGLLFSEMKTPEKSSDEYRAIMFISFVICSIIAMVIHFHLYHLGE